MEKARPGQYDARKVKEGLTTHSGKPRLSEDEVTVHLADSSGRRCRICGGWLADASRPAFTPGDHVEKVNQGGPSSAWRSDNALTCHRPITSSREHASRLCSEVFVVLRNGRPLTPEDAATFQKMRDCLGNLLGAT